MYSRKTKKNNCKSIKKINKRNFKRMIATNHNIIFKNKLMMIL